MSARAPDGRQGVLTVADALRRGAARLAAAGVDTPALDARLLLAHAAGRDQSTLLRDRGAVVDGGAYQALLDRRAAREPVARILGRQGFWTLDLEVSADTLVPRPDSETLIEAALAARPGRDRVRRVLDLGTGTGCLLLAALSEFPQAWGLGLDRFPATAAVARRNAAAAGLAGRASVVAGDWAAPLAGRFDLVLSNPPYVARPDLARLMPEVALFEPPRALDGGEDGLDAYRALLRALPGLLAPGGLAVFELGAGQAGPVAAMARAEGFGTAVRADLGGVDRALLLEKKVGIRTGPI